MHWLVVNFFDIHLSQCSNCLLIGVTCQCDDVRQPLFSLNSNDLSTCLNTVHHWHLDIHNNKLEGSIFASTRSLEPFLVNINGFLTIVSQFWENFELFFYKSF